AVVLSEGSAAAAGAGIEEGPETGGATNRDVPLGEKGVWDTAAGRGISKDESVLALVSDLQACSKALAKACTVAKRDLTSLASAVSTTSSTAGEMPGTFSRS